MNESIKKPCGDEPYHSSTTIEDSRKTDDQVGY